VPPAEINRGVLTQKKSQKKGERIGRVYEKNQQPSTILTNRAWERGQKKTHTTGESAIPKTKVGFQKEKTKQKQLVATKNKEVEDNPPPTVI